MQILYSDNSIVICVKPVGLDSEKEYSTFQAHKGACESLERYGSRQSPQYSPIETSYPFAIRLGGAN